MNWWHRLVPPTRGGCLTIPFLMLAGLTAVVVVAQLVKAVAA